MLRLLSWSSGLGPDRVTSQEVDYFTAQRHRAPTVELQKAPMLKRKRVDSVPGDLARGRTKRRMQQLSQLNITTNVMPTEGSFSLLPNAASARPAQSVSEIQTLGHDKMEMVQSTQDPSANIQQQLAANIRTKPDKEMLRQTLDSQIGLEILLKHNELRLIDQEIAKCQIALEQLRRCTEIPFPITRPSLNVSQGQGPAVRSSRSAVPAESPAPWGVTNGPYTRHYAKWLLPDSLFDGGEPSGQTSLMTPAGKTPTKGRSTRGNFVESGISAGKSKVQRANKFQALSSGYPQPKEKPGPMVQKRKSDGLLVKLVCLDCRRDNFSSAQGFINHCRIAHGRNFASHDAAADACGEPVDVDEAGAVVGSDGPPSASVAGLVHPLIYSAHLLKQESLRKTSDTDIAAETTSLPAAALEASSAKTSASWSAPHLNPSSLTPNLSTLMRRQGGNLDLQSLVADMKTSIPVDESSESEGEDNGNSSMVEAPPLGRHPHPTGSMQPARLCASTQSDAASSSRKGMKNRRMVQDLAKSSSMARAQAATTAIPPSPYVPTIHSEALERSPTNESNQAPSLVDDDGDDDYEAHSPSYSGSGSVDTENRELDFEIEDGDERGPSTRNRNSETDFSSTPKHHAPPTPTRRASAFRRSIGGREEKHVSFVSPSPAPDAEPIKKGGDRKRRRTGSG